MLADSDRGSCLYIYIGRNQQYHENLTEAWLLQNAYTRSGKSGGKQNAHLGVLRLPRTVLRTPILSTPEGTNVRKVWTTPSDLEHKPLLVACNPRTNARHRNLYQYSAKGKGDTSLHINFTISLTLSAWRLKIVIENRKTLPPTQCHSWKTYAYLHMRLSAHVQATSDSGGFEK